MDNKNQLKYEFKKNGYFYKMVTSYTTAICGLLIFHPYFYKRLKDFNIQKHGKLITLGSREVPK